MEVIEQTQNSSQVAPAFGHNILQLRESSGFYGAENVVIELSKGLQQAGHRSMVAILTRSPKQIRVFKRTAQENQISTRVYKNQRIIDLGVILRLRRLLRKHNISIVLSHGYTSNFYALAATAFSRVRRVAVCHPWAESKYSARARFYERLDLSWLRFFDDVVAVSKNVQDKILKNKISPQKVSLIANGLDISRFNYPIDREGARESLAIPRDGFVIGSVGRLSVEKGHRILIEAIKPLVKVFPNLYLTFVGDGPLKYELTQLSRRLGIENNVRFMGKVHNIPMMLSLMDIFVLPSFSEGLPMALLEAMAAKVPVIASKVGDIPLVISDGKEGLLVDPKNVEHLRDALLVLLGDGAKRNEFAQRAFEKVNRKYSMQKMTEKYLQLFDPSTKIMEN